MIGPSFDTSAISFDCIAAKQALVAVVKIMKMNPKISYQIEGHTDEVGDEASNVILGKKRADSTLATMLQIAKESTEIPGSGVEFSKNLATRLKTVSYGETRPLHPDRLLDGSKDTDGLRRNRRVEFLRSDFDCEAALLGAARNSSTAKGVGNQRISTTILLGNSASKVAVIQLGGDSCVYATQEAQTNILNQYLVQNVVGATTVNE